MGSEFNPSRATDADSLGLEAFRSIDRMQEALGGQLTGGLSPAAMALACFDWMLHLAAAPGKRIELAYKAGRKASRLAAYMATALTQPDTPACIKPLPGDNRFRERAGVGSPIAAGRRPSCSASNGGTTPPMKYPA